MTARQVSGGKTEYYLDGYLSRSDSIGFYITKDGFGYSRDMTSSTGAIVQLEGVFNPQDFYVNHGNQKIKFDRRGVSQFVSIPAFQSYHVDIGNDSAQSYDIQPVDGNDKIRLFPGNIAIIRYQVKPRYPLYASFSCDGALLKRSVLKSSIDTARTDEDGFTTINVTPDDAIYVLDNQGNEIKSIQFTTKGIHPEDGFAFVDTLYCK